MDQEVQKGDWQLFELADILMLKVLFCQLL